MINIIDRYLILYNIIDYSSEASTSSICFASSKGGIDNIAK